MAFLIALLAAVQAANLNLKYESAEKPFQLTISQNEISFASGARKVKKEITTCGRPAFDNFVSKVNATLAGEPYKLKSKVKAAAEVTLNAEKSYVLPLSKTGVLLSRMETEIDYLIGEAVYRCSKK